jgi:hypothetical protein
LSEHDEAIKALAAQIEKAGADMPPLKVPRPWFGLRPAAVGSPVELYWGARALYYPHGNYAVEILWDRQSWSDQDADEALAEAHAPTRKVISDWWNTRGRARLEAECKRQVLSGADNYVIHVHERAFHIIANPKRSHGYLYIAVWKDTAHAEHENTEHPPQEPQARRSARAKKRR